MKVEKVTANIRMSAQLPSGSWKSVEFGAEASLGPEEAWEPAQGRLYADLVVQLTEVWSTAIKNGSPAGADAPANSAPAEPICPAHKISRPSRHGGLFCPGKDPTGNHCSWTCAVVAPARAAA